MRKSEMKSLSIKEFECSFNKKMKADYCRFFGKKIAQLPPEELQKRIHSFLTNNCIGTLATCADGVPRATPVRYKNKELDIYILTEGGGKLYNLERNPAVSFSVYGNYSGFKTVRGLQLWGQAHIINYTDRQAYAEAYAFLNLGERSDLKDIDLQKIRTDMYFIKIVPHRIRFLSFPQGILNEELAPDT